MKEPYISKSYAKGKLIHIWEPVFTSNWLIVISKDRKDFKRLLKRHWNIEVEEVPENSRGRFALVSDSKYNSIALWLKDKTPEYMAHEVLHGVNCVLEDRGIKLSQETEEVFCYYQQFIMRQLLAKDRTYGI